MSDEQNPSNGKRVQSDADKAFAEAVRRASEQAEPAKAPWEVHPNTYLPPRIPEGQMRRPPNESMPTGMYVPPASGASYGRPTPGEFQVADPQGRSNALQIIGWIAAGILVVGLIIWGIVPPNITAPTAFATYTSPDQRFSCDLPEGWDVTSTPASSTEANEIGGALFKEGPAKIDITTDTVADLKQAVLVDSAQALPDDFTADPTPVLHKMQKASASVLIRQYVEKNPEPRDMEFGEALVSEFTGQGGLFGLGGPIHGYRVSASDGDTTIEVMMQCPERNWAALEPAFSHVIASFAPVSDSGGGSSAPAPTTDFGSAGTPVPSGGAAGAAGGSAGGGYGGGGGYRRHRSQQPSGIPGLPNVGYDGAPIQNNAPADNSQGSGDDSQ